VSGETLRISGKARQGVHDRLAARGFSLIEMCVVVAILMVVASMVFITAVTSLEGIRLTTSATSYADLLQQARIRAVKDDQYYTVKPLTGDTPGAYLDLATPTGGASYTCTTTQCDPMIALAANVTIQAFSSGPGLANLEAQFLPAGSSSIATVNTVDNPTFGPRGLPCTAAGGTCPYLNGLGIPTSYITFLQNTRTTNWEAVTVSPAGRIRVWKYDNGAWSAMN
jgi:prepilin-type N-terminal cleavage/methylation domain-containing protein